MRARGRLAASGLCALLALGGPVRAAAPEDPNAMPHAGTEKVQVSAEGAEAAASPTSFATILRASDWAGRFATLADLLDETAGVRVRSWGGVNSFATVSIRGSSAEQVIVAVDGVPLNSPAGGGVNLADVPLSGIESIEIWRGFAPSTLGASSIGGAIHLKTRRPEGGRALAGSVSGGSYGTAALDVTGDFETGRFRWNASAEGISTRGDFTFLDNNGTLLTDADDAWTSRANNTSWSSGARLRGETTFGNGATFFVGADASRRRQGVPGIDAFQSEHATASAARGTLRAGASWAPGESSTLETSLDHDVTESAFDDSGGPIAPQPRDTETRVTATGARFRWEWRPSPAHRLSFLAEPRVHRAQSEDHLRGAAAPLRAERISASAVAEDAVHLAGGRLLLSPSIRFDWLDDGAEGGAPGSPPPASGTEASWGGRAGALFVASRRLSLKGNVGRYFRAPTLLDRYGDQGSLAGNPALRPEEGINADLGLVYERAGTGALGRLRAEIAAFRTDADDLIQLVPLPSRQIKPFNIGRARITGVEAAAALRLWGRLTASANYTRQKAVDRGDTYHAGSDLPGRPRDEAATSLALSLGPVTPFHRFTYIGENELGTIGAAASNLPPGRESLTRLPARYLHDIGLRAALGANAEATIEIANLLDRHVVDVARYPLPGRTVTLKISGRL